MTVLTSSASTAGDISESEDMTVTGSGASTAGDISESEDMTVPGNSVKEADDAGKVSERDVPKSQLPSPMEWQPDALHPDPKEERKILEYQRDKAMEWG